MSSACWIIREGEEKDKKEEEKKRKRKRKKKRKKRIEERREEGSKNSTYRTRIARKLAKVRLIRLFMRVIKATINIFWRGLLGWGGYDAFICQ